MADEIPKPDIDRRGLLSAMVAAPVLAGAEPALVNRTVSNKNNNEHKGHMNMDAKRKMTMEDMIARESIRYTINKANVMAGRGAQGTVMAIYTEDAIMEFESIEPGKTVIYQGHAAINEFFRQLRAGGKPEGYEKAAPPSKGLMRHHIGTCHIELTGPDTAEGETYFAVITDIGLDRFGRYIDRYRKVGDEWLISYRRPMVEYAAANSLFGK